MEIEFLTEEKILTLEESVGWLSKYNGSDGEVLHVIVDSVDDSFEERNRIKTELLWELGVLNRRREQIIKEICMRPEFELDFMNISKRLSEHLESEEWIKSIEAMDKRNELYELRLNYYREKIRSWIKTHSHDDVMKFFDWEKKIEERYYSKGVIKGSNLLEYVIKLFDQCEMVVDDEEPFLSEVLCYGDYTIHCYYGQGCYYIFSYKGNTIFRTT